MVNWQLTTKTRPTNSTDFCLYRPQNKGTLSQIIITLEEHHKDAFELVCVTKTQARLWHADPSKLRAKLNDKQRPWKSPVANQNRKQTGDECRGHRVEPESQFYHQSQFCHRQCTINFLYLVTSSIVVIRPLEATKRLKQWNRGQYCVALTGEEWGALHCRLSLWIHLIHLISYWEQ